MSLEKPKQVTRPAACVMMHDRIPQVMPRGAKPPQKSKNTQQKTKEGLDAENLVVKPATPPQATPPATTQRATPPGTPPKMTPRRATPSGTPRRATPTSTPRQSERKSPTRETPPVSPDNVDPPAAWAAGKRPVKVPYRRREGPSAVERAEQRRSERRMI